LEQASPERIIQRVSGIISDDVAAVITKNPCSAQAAASLMNMPRPIIPISTPTEQKVVEQLAIPFRNDFKAMAAAYNSIAQISSSMTLKTPQHMESFFNLRGGIASSISNTTKNMARKGRGGDRRSQKFKRAKAPKENEQIDGQEQKDSS
jgi:hypothetical protein